MEISYWCNIINGDKEAFLLFYHKYYRALFCYGYSLSADRELTKDVIQELFLDIWNTRSTLNKDVENIQSYLFTWLRRKISRKQLRLSKDKIYLHSVEGVQGREFCYEELLIEFQLTDLKGAIMVFTPTEGISIGTDLPNSAYTATDDGTGRYFVAWGGYWTGDLDDIMIYNTPLTASQVTQVYNQQLTQ